MSARRGRPDERLSERARRGAQTAGGLAAATATKKLLAAVVLKESILNPMIFGRMAFADDPQRWRARAAGARAEAQEMFDEAARRGMLSIAGDYERMAERAERRRASRARKRAVDLHPEG